MFEVGFTELLVIFVLALIVLGPEKLPRLAAQVGRWIGRARAMARQFREQLEEEVNVADMNKWQQTSTSATREPPPATYSPAETAPVAEPTPPAAATSESASESKPDQGEPTEHFSGPPPEPEASTYEPPAYASSSGASSSGASSSGASSSGASSSGASSSGTTPSHAVESPPGHPTNYTASNDDTVAEPDERPARPGDVITTTHERGI